MAKKEITAKSYYKFGIFMIFPLIGLILGIIFLRKGVILKDRLLYYIGLTGILFTVGFYVWIFYYGNHSQKAKEHDVMFTQYQLNLTMQEVEIYKLGNGYYPPWFPAVQKKV